MREVTLAEFAAADAKGVAVVDVREPFEYVEGHVPGARSVPLGQLPTVIRELPRTGPAYVICASGNRSMAAAGFLARAGAAGSVVGGTKAWVRSGHPVPAGTRPHAEGEA